MRTGFIYKATSPNGTSYIGQTVKEYLYQRKAQHTYEAHRMADGKWVYNTKFARALRKYGPNVTWEILYSNVPVGFLNEMEKWIIDAYGTRTNGYNSTDGGKSQSGFKHSEASRLLMSVAATGRKMSEETKEKHRQRMIGKKLPPEWVEKARRGKLGKQISESTKELLRRANLGKKHSIETRRKMSQSRKRWLQNHGS